MSIQIIFSWAILALLNLSLYIQVSGVQRYLSMKNHVQHYLCLKEGVQTATGHHQRMIRLNRSIQTLSYAQILAASNPKILAIIRKQINFLQRMQTMARISFKKNIATLSHCSLAQRSAFLLWNNFSLNTRYPDGTLTLRRHQEWRFILISRNQSQKRNYPIVTHILLKQQDRFAPLTYHVQSSTQLKRRGTFFSNWPSG